MRYRQREVQEETFDYEIWKRCLVGAIMCALGIAIGVWMLIEKPGGLFFALIFFYFCVPTFVHCMKYVITGNDFECMNRH